MSYTPSGRETVKLCRWQLPGGLGTVVILPYLQNFAAGGCISHTQLPTLCRGGAGAHQTCHYSRGAGVLDCLRTLADFRALRAQGPPRIIHLNSGAPHAPRGSSDKAGGNAGASRK